MWQLPSGSSKHETLVFHFSSTPGPSVSLFTHLFSCLYGLRFTVLTNTSVNEQMTSKEKGNLFLQTGGWWDSPLRLLSDTMFNLGEEKQWVKTGGTKPKHFKWMWDKRTREKEKVKCILRLKSKVYFFLDRHIPCAQLFSKWVFDHIIILMTFFPTPNCISLIAYWIEQTRWCGFV